MIITFCNAKREALFTVFVTSIQVSGRIVSIEEKGNRLQPKKRKDVTYELDFPEVYRVEGGSTFLVESSCNSFKFSIILNGNNADWLQEKRDELRDLGFSTITY